MPKSIDSRDLSLAPDPPPRARGHSPSGAPLPARSRSARGARVTDHGRFRKLTEIGLATGVFVIAGLGFTYKMTEFGMTIVNDEVEGFGAMAVATYLIGMVPLTFLMLWAVFTGRFRDLEATKRRLFEIEAEIERGDYRA